MARSATIHEMGGMPPARRLLRLVAALVAPCALAACWGQGAPSAAAPESTAPSASSSPSTEPHVPTEGTWPDYGREGIDVVEVDVPWSVEFVQDPPEYDADLVGRSAHVLWDRANPRTVRISTPREAAQSWEYTVEGSDRYVGAVVFSSPETAYLAEVPSRDQIVIGGPAGVLLRLDLGDQSVHEVAPPEGTKWTAWPGQLVSGDSGTFWNARRADDSGDCVVAIDQGASRLLTCLEGQFASFAAVDSGGVSVLTFPAGQNSNDCRQRWHVPAEGGEAVGIGTEPGCTRFDGLILDGWQIWSEVSPSVPEALYEAGLLADGPEGQELSLGMMRTGSLVACGEYAYWQAALPVSNTVAYETLRWRPGGDHVERVFADETIDVYTGALRCSGGVLNLTEVASMADPPTNSLLVIGEAAQ